jgi:hypothetical protein
MNAITITFDLNKLTTTEIAALYIIGMNRLPFGLDRQLVLEALDRQGVALADSEYDDEVNTLRSVFENGVTQ